MESIVEWAGSIMGAIGALLLAWNHPTWSRYGFVCFLASNFFLVAFAIITQANGLMMMQVVCTITSIIGIWRWFNMPQQLQPAKD